MSRANIMKTLLRATPEDYVQGMSAYQDYHNILKAVAETEGLPLNRVVAAFAALSPNTRIESNFKALFSLVKGYKQGLFPEDINTFGYHHAKRRAYSYLCGGKEFTALKTAPKTRAFYHNLLNPESALYVTVDGHAYNIWKGKRQPLKDVRMKKGVYVQISQDYKEVAQKTGLLPHQVQAITWYAWRNIKN